jgi:hypothetical protein
MMQQVGVRPADLGSDRLQRHRLRSVREQETARSLDRGRAALFGAQSFASY